MHLLGTAATTRFRVCSVIASALAVGLTLGCGQGTAPDEGGALPSRQLAELAGPTMGTAYSVRIVTEETLSLATKTDLLEAVEATLAEVNSSMSTYLEDSEISLLNRAPVGAPVVVSSPFLVVLEEARRLSELTEGAFDVTVGPLVNAYGFGPTEGDLPDEEELEALREQTGYERLEIDSEASSVTKSQSELYVDLSALAKGYAVDRVAAVLEERGYSEFLVEIGGEVQTSGANLEGDSWRIGIERPEFSLGASQRPLQRIVALGDQAMATSGDYRNFREVDGKRLTHIVDPRTGRSVHHTLASVTVVHELCMTADGLATALMVLGPEEAAAFAEANGLAVLLLVRVPPGEGGGAFEERASTAWTRLLG